MPLHFSQHTGDGSNHEYFAFEGGAPSCEQGCAQDAGLRKFFERLVVEAQPLATATATATASVQPLCDDSQVHSDTELSADAAARPQGSDGRAEGEHARTGAGADGGNGNGV